MLTRKKTPRSPRLQSHHFSLGGESRNSLVDYKQLLTRVAATCKLYSYAQLENIAFGDDSSDVSALQVIDFEYSGYNPRAFDIANHFCEVGLFRMHAA